MARKRLPNQLAAVTGASLRNPARYAERFDPQLPPLGDPPEYLSKTEKEHWQEYRSEMPWLARSDRYFVSLVCHLSARLEEDPDFPMSGFAQLRLCLSSMGATPVDRSKINAGPPEPPDSGNKFFS